MLYLLFQISRSALFKLENEPLKGILYDLFKNNTIKNDIKLHPSSTWSDPRTLYKNTEENLLNFSLNYRWHSHRDESKTPYIIFEFAKKYLYITNYTFSLQASNLPRGWKVEASNDKANWVKIHSKDNYDAQKEGVIKSFQTRQGVFKYFKFTQFGNIHNNDPALYDNTFVLKRVEFFGFYGAKLNSIAMKTNRFILSIFIISFLLIS